MQVFILTQEILDSSTLVHSLARQNIKSIVLSHESLAKYTYLDADAILFHETLQNVEWNGLLSTLLHISKKIPLLFLGYKDPLLFKVLSSKKLLEQSIFLDAAIPFSQLPLLIREIIQKAAPKEDITIGSITLDRLNRTVLLEDDKVELSKKEFFLFELFLINHGRIISRDYIIDYVWDKRRYVAQNTIDVHISRLRKKMAPYPSRPTIRTVPSLGYTLDLATSSP